MVGKTGRNRTLFFSFPSIPNHYRPIENELFFLQILVSQASSDRLLLPGLHDSALIPLLSLYHRHTGSDIPDPYTGVFDPFTACPGLPSKTTSPLLCFFHMDFLHPPGTMDSLAIHHCMVYSAYGRRGNSHRRMCRIP